MSPKSEITCGNLIKKAREAKGMDVADLAIALKDRKINEKLIKKWEMSKDYPDLDTCYKLAYVLEINPTRLLALRDIERKKFKVKKKKRKWYNEEVPEEVIYVLEGILRLAIIFIFLAIIAFYLKFVNSFNTGGARQMDEYLVNIVENNVEENVKINGIKSNDII